MSQTKINKTKTRKTQKNDTLESELNDTRIRLYEQTKNMTTQERVSFINNGARTILARYGIKANFAEPPPQKQPLPQGTSNFGSS